MRDLCKKTQCIHTWTPRQTKSIPTNHLHLYDFYIIINKYLNHLADMYCFTERTPFYMKHILHEWIWCFTSFPQFEYRNMHILAQSHLTTQFRKHKILRHSDTVRPYGDLTRGLHKPAQMAKFMGPTWVPPGSCRPQMGPCWAHELAIRVRIQVSPTLSIQSQIVEFISPTEVDVRTKLCFWYPNHEKKMIYDMLFLWDIWISVWRLCDRSPCKMMYMVGVI